VVALVSGVGVAPLLANVGGWVMAFGVSFLGHLRLSFGDQRPPPARAETTAQATIPMSASWARRLKQGPTCRARAACQKTRAGTTWRQGQETKRRFRRTPAEGTR